MKKNETAAILYFFCVQDNPCNIFSNGCYAFIVTGIQFAKMPIKFKKPANYVLSWIVFCFFKA